jgi:CheY-like chemotaxis protein/HPt (histidine-containing phosphotransfer) domain-containing protein
LDFSKIEAGHLELDPTDFELRGAVEEACQMLAEQAHSQGLGISNEVDANLPTTVNGDRGRLRQILLNLLSNAIKFTTVGEVLVRVSGAGGDMVRFQVSDTGVGIDGGKAARLFEPFVQGDQSTTRLFGGTGIGLTIARELVHQMRGAIGAEPRTGGGSTFWFTAELPSVATPEQPLRARPELLGLRALVVDSYETNRTIFEHYLSSWGLASESVDSPTAAVEELERAARGGVPFQLVVLDHDMPQENGVDLVRAIRARPVLRALQILILSSSPLDRTAFPDLGVCAVLSKPIRRSQLYNAVAEAIADSPLHRESQPAAKTPENPNGPLVLIAEDNKINDAVASALLAKQGLRTAVAHNGREAVEMALANDYAAILMDCQMPEIDGYEATRRIRHAEHGRHVPIIAMTAHSMTGDRERCLAAGMDDYLSKPVRADELQAIMTQQLSGDARDLRLRDTTGAVLRDLEPVPGGAGEVFDEAVVRELREELTVETREDLVRAFEDSLPKCMAEIEDAVRRGDTGERRRAAHLLKGSSASIGASGLTLSCQRLEQSSPPQDAAIEREQVAELRVAGGLVRAALRDQLL